MLRGLEDLTHEEWWKKLGLFTIEKRCLKGNLITAFQCFIEKPDVFSSQGRTLEG